VGGADKEGKSNVVKLIVTWNIRDGKETEFLDFINNDFTRLFLAMNIQPTEAWYAIWGQGPQAMICGVARDQAAMETAMSGPEWEEANAKIAQFAKDVRTRVVEKTDGFQL